MDKRNYTLSAVFAALVLVFAPVAVAATTQQQNTYENALENQNIVKESIEMVDDADIDTRYSPIGKVESNEGLAAIAVECPPGEIPENAQYQLAQFVNIESNNRVALDDSTLAWLMVVRNYGEENQWVWLAVDCVEDITDDDDDDNEITARIDQTNVFKFINKNIVINKNVTVIGNGTGGNGSVVIPPPGNNTNGGPGGNNNTNPDVEQPGNDTIIEAPTGGNGTTTGGGESGGNTGSNNESTGSNTSSTSTGNESPNNGGGTETSGGNTEGGGSEVTNNETPEATATTNSGGTEESSTETPSATGESTGGSNPSDTQSSEGNGQPSESNTGSGESNEEED